jgi:hypothetical protein
MRRSEAFPSQYLSKDDVMAAGVLRATIAGCTIRSVGMEDNAEDKPVLTFREGYIKAMPLNTTNWNIIEAVYGDDSDGWVGKVVEIWHDPSVMFKGKTTGGTRIRIPAGVVPVAAAAAAAMTTPADGAAKPALADVMTIEQAIATATGAGMTREDFLGKLRPQCEGGYSGRRDTIKARAIISAFAFQEGDASVPF